MELTPKHLTTTVIRIDEEDKKKILNIYDDITAMMGEDGKKTCEENEYETT